MYTQLAIIEASNLMHPLFTKWSTITAKWGRKKKSQPREGEYIYNDVLYGQEFERSKTKSKPHPIFHFQL